VSATETIDYNKLVAQMASNDWQVRDAARKAIEQGGKAGLSAFKQAFAHADWRVRRECAAFMDHNADQTCVRMLAKALKDPNASVRRNAVHSLSCDRCKPAPLTFDAVPILLDVAQNDRSINVRRTAIGLLHGKKPDARVVPVMQAILAVEKNERLIRHATAAMQKHQSAIEKAAT
jgi:HEAT repeat protein